MASSRFDPALLSDLAGRPASVVVQELTVLREALPTAGDPAVLGALAAAIPKSVGALGPEVGGALVQVAESLVPFAPKLPGDADRLEPWLRTQWLRVGIAAGEPGIESRLDDRALHWVVADWSLAGVLDRRPVLRRLIDAEDPRLRARGLDELRAAVAELALDAGEALALLGSVVEDPDIPLRARAVGQLADAFLFGLSPVDERTRDRLVVQSLGDSEPTVAEAAVRTAAALGRREWLLERLLDPSTPGSVRVVALDALGPLALDEDLDIALELAGSEPLRFGPGAHRFVLQAHRHGVFVREGHLAPLLSAFDAHPGWTGAALVRVTHIVRQALVEQLATLPADDARWVRRAAVLGASVAANAPRVLAEQLRTTRTPPIAEALVEAAGRSAGFDDEAALLSWLDALPEAVIPVLAVKGGELSEQRLRVLVLDPLTSSAVRRLAMGPLWSLARDRGALLRELAAALGPHESELLDRARLQRRDHGIARLMAESPWPLSDEHAIDPEQRMTVLCESGDIEQRSAVEALFRELLRGYVRKALDGDFTIKRIMLPELEQKVFRYGRALVSEGRNVRRCIEAGPQTGRDLVLCFACDWLDDEPAPAVMVALLEMVGRHAPAGTTLRRIEPLWRSKHREVQRAAIEAILAAGEGARGLELSLGRLARHPEPRVLVQALAAVGTLGASWAEPMVVEALRHPHMGVKKEAAAALAQMATERSVVPIVEQLAHHDNAGFRAELKRALGRTAGPLRGAILVRALETEHERRRIELLWEALGGQLSLAAAVRLARSEHPAHRRLLDACLEGVVSLADGDRDALAARLHRARLRPAESDDDPGRRLRIEGFDPEAARSLVEARAPERESAVLATVRGALADWIAWLRAEPEAGPDALTLVLDATQSRHTEHADALLTVIERQPEAPDPGAVAGFIERCLAARGVERSLQIRAIDWLRQAPGDARLGGLRRFRVLGRLRATCGREDLWRCLEECRIRPEAPRESAELLLDALRIPRPSKDEPAAITELRDQARRFPTRPEAERRAWLDATLDERPLGLPVTPAVEAPRKPPFVPCSFEDLQMLQRGLLDEDPQRRSLAAARLLDWPGAHEARPLVLEAYLSGRVTVKRTHLSVLAAELSEWPEDEDASARAAELWRYCAPWQRRRFVREWVRRFEAGRPEAGKHLERASDDLLIPVLAERVQQGDARLARFLGARSLAVRTLMAQIEQFAPDEVEHLQPRPEASEPGPEPDDAVDPSDPIAGKSADDLVALIEHKGVAKGLAVRAVHALTAHGERGIEALERLVTDRRPPVRSAALRALRKVSPREQSLAATARALAMESRRDVILSLMKSLGHGRHEPSLGALIERLEHRDPRVRQGAHAAIVAWGPAVVSALRRAHRKARPDRRPALAELMAELQAIDDDA